MSYPRHIAQVAMRRIRSVVRFWSIMALHSSYPSRICHTTPKVFLNILLAGTTADVMILQGMSFAPSSPLLRWFMKLHTCRSLLIHKNCTGERSACVTCLVFPWWFILLWHIQKYWDTAQGTSLALPHILSRPDFSWDCCRFMVPVKIWVAGSLYRSWHQTW